MNKTTRYTCLFFLLSCLFHHSNGQYIMQQSLFTLGEKITYRDIPFKRVLMKGKGANLLLYIKHDSADSVQYEIKTLSLPTGKVTNNVYLPNIGNQFHVTDIVPLESSTVFLGFGKMIFFEDNKKKELFKSEGVDFSNGVRLNDTLILLYTLYNYHPNDGECGMHFTIFNVNTKQFEKHKLIQFPGIALGHMTINWVTAQDGFIYAFAGLSGRVFKYDANLEKISETHIPSLFPDSLQRRSVAYEHMTDSLIYNEWHELKKQIAFVNQYNDTAKQKLSVKSTIYGKDFMSNTSKEVRGQLCFVEKVFPFNTNEVLLSISYPEYGLKYRDLVKYNIPENRITNVIRKWSIAKKNIIAQKEDLFPVDLVNDAVVAPYFYKDEVYCSSFYNINAFTKGELDSVKLKLYNYTLENGYQWNLLQYHIPGY